MNKLPAIAFVLVAAWLCAGTAPADVTEATTNQQCVLKWDPPTAMSDGTALDQAILSHYVVYRHTSSTDIESHWEMRVNPGQALEYPIPPVLGTWYFGVRAFHTNGTPGLLAVSTPLTLTAPTADDVIGRVLIEIIIRTLAP